jgi:DNA-binding SARP family transcriptional activator
MIGLELLGPVRISVNGAAPPAELLWRKNLALLIYLACSPKRGRTRDHLVGLLWPDKPESASRRSLTVALSTIRQLIGDGCLETVADQIRLEAGTVQLDTDQFARLEAAGDWRAAAAMVSGAFVEGLAVPGATGFEEWLSGERRVWSGRAIAVLLRLAQAELDRGAQRSAVDVARRAVAIAPCGDAAVMMLMRALALDGDHAGALREYDEFAARLVVEVGTQPSAACTALADRIRRSPGVAGPLRRQSSPDRRRAPLVGRGSELERLLEGWGRARDAGKAVATFLVGDAGVGKTRLAEELTARMRFEGSATAMIRAVEGDRITPWSGVIGLARGGLLEAGGVPGATPGALAWFTERIPEWADRFAAARGTTVAASPVHALSEVLSAALAVQPVALVVDDVEQLDRDSLLAIGSVLRDLIDRPLYVLCTSTEATARPELDELRARVGRDVPGGVVRLTALDSDDIKQLARWAVPDYGDAELERLARRVSTDSAGLPLLVVELLSAVAAGLDLGKVRGAWPEAFRTLDQTLPGDLPEAVVGAIRVGFRRLSPAAQHQLQALAVIEGRVTAARLGRATGLGAEAVTGALDELEWNRWIVADGRGYAFAARIVREVVRQDLVLPGQRLRLMEAAGPA